MSTEAAPALPRGLSALLPVFVGQLQRQLTTRRPDALAAALADDLRPHLPAELAPDLSATLRALAERIEP